MTRERVPDVSDLGLPLALLSRRWIVSGALGRNTRGKTEKALDAAERLELNRSRREHRCRRGPLVVHETVSGFGCRLLGNLRLSFE
jgi:hypothetical protein